MCTYVYISAYTYIYPSLTASVNISIPNLIYIIIDSIYLYRWMDRSIDLSIHLPTNLPIYFSLYSLV